MKKLLLIIALLISALGLNAQYATIGDLEFTVTNEAPAECEVSGYSGELTDVTIPSTVTISGKEYTVTSIGEDAFHVCSSLTSIEIPSGVTSIGEGAFSFCSSLTSIEIPSGVTSIGEYVFFDCYSLTSIELPSSVTSIGKEAFSGCSSLTSIEIPSGVTSIGYYAFSFCCSLTSIEIPSGVTSIGGFAFDECYSLTSIELPSSVTSIGTNPFAECPSLISIVVESGNTVYDSRNDCNAIIETATHTLIAGCQNTVIPNTVTSIGYCAFDECSSLISIEIPSGVTSIGEYVFSDCYSLTSIELPSSVTSIGEKAFSRCSKLTSIYCYAEIVPETGSSAFAGCPSDMVIYVPAISVNDYKATSPWNNYTIMPLACVVTASSNPEKAGVITGTGEYTFNDTVTLKATANEGYKFVSWTENGELVYIEENYIFTIKGNRNLVANFEKLEDPEEPGEGVEELTSSFNIYPNPVNDKLYIETLTQTLIVEIYDVYGRRQVIETPSHQGNLIIDVTNLDSGVYFVKVVTENGEAVKRILKF